MARWIEPAAAPARGGIMAFCNQRLTAAAAVELGR